MTHSILCVIVFVSIKETKENNKSLSRTNQGVSPALVFPTALAHFTLFVTVSMSSLSFVILPFSDYTLPSNPVLRFKEGHQLLCFRRP
jgi:hypothetical protein